LAIEKFQEATKVIAVSQRPSLVAGLELSPPLTRSHVTGDRTNGCLIRQFLMCPRQLASLPMRPQAKTFTVETRKSRKSPSQHEAELLGIKPAAAEPAHSPFVTGADRLFGTIRTSHPILADGNLADLAARKN
jgi:hypothetical protein